MPSDQPSSGQRAWINAFKQPIQFAYRPPHTPTPQHMLDLLGEAEIRKSESTKTRR